MNEVSPKPFIVILLLLAVFAAFFEIGLRDVVDDNEGQRATPPAEMIRTGDYVIPTLNGQDYLAKPPLVYWMIAGMYKATGMIQPWAARIPAGVCFIVLVMSVYLCGMRLVGEKPARWAALAALSAPYILDRGRYAELDVPLTLATFLAVVLMYEALRSERPWRVVALTLLGGVLLGAGVMLKGPVPFLFLAPGWLAYAVISGRDAEAWLKAVMPWTAGSFGLALVLWLAGLLGLSLGFPVALALMLGAWVVYALRLGERRLRAAGVLAAFIVIAAVVAAPWAVAVVHAKGWPYVTNLLHSESLQRTHTATAINSGAPFYYLLGLLGMLAPWGLLLPAQAARTSWKNGGTGYRFSLLAGWMSVLVFSLIAGKEYEYILPGIPFLLLALGWQLEARELDAWAERLRGYWLRYVPHLLVLLAAAFLIVTVTKHKQVRLWFEALVLTGVVLWLAWRGLKHPRRRLGAIALMALCTVMVWSISQTYRYTGKRSPRDIAQMTAALLDAGYKVEAAKMTTAFDVFPGFAFHAGRYIPTTTEPDHILANLRGANPYYCVVSEKMLKMFPQLPPEYATPLFGPYTKKKLMIIGNQPLPAGVVGAQGR